MGYGSQAEREFSWYLKGPLKACEMALRLKTHTAEAAMLFLGGRGRKKGGQSPRRPPSPRSQPGHLGSLGIGASGADAGSGRCAPWLLWGARALQLRHGAVSGHGACHPPAWDRCAQPRPGRRRAWDSCLLRLLNSGGEKPSGALAAELALPHPPRGSPTSPRCPGSRGGRWHRPPLLFAPPDSRAHL